MSEATPRPWKVEINIETPWISSMDGTVFDFSWGSPRTKKTDQANAALIVRAVNHHDELVELLQYIKRYYGSEGTVASAGPLRDDFINRARAVLAKIEVKP